MVNFIIVNIYGFRILKLYEWTVNKERNDRTIERRQENWTFLEFENSLASMCIVPTVTSSVQIGRFLNIFS